MVSPSQWQRGSQSSSAGYAQGWKRLILLPTFADISAITSNVTAKTRPIKISLTKVMFFNTWNLSMCRWQLRIRYHYSRPWLKFVRFSKGMNLCEVTEESAGETGMSHERRKGPQPDSDPDTTPAQLSINPLHWGGGQWSSDPRPAYYLWLIYLTLRELFN